jgi:Right handed beta helix region
VKRTRLELAAIVALTLAMAPLASAASPSETWVSPSGNNTMPCSLSAPCSSIQRAVDLASAGGEVNVIDPIENYGVTIAKAITIDGGNKTYVIGPASGTAIQVKAGPSDVVVIKNLSIVAPVPSSLNYGIDWTGGAALYLENVSIVGASIGVHAASPGSILVSRNVTIRQSSAVGVMVAGTAASLVNAVFDHVAIDGVSGGPGFSIQNGQVAVTHCSVTGPKTSGIEVYAPAAVDIEDSTFAFAGRVGVSSDLTGSTVRIAGSNIHDNPIGVIAANGGQLLSFGTNRLSGNVTDGTFSGTVTLK